MGLHHGQMQNVHRFNCKNKKGGQNKEINGTNNAKYWMGYLVEGKYGKN